MNKTTYLHLMGRGLYKQAAGEESTPKVGPLKDSIRKAQLEAAKEELQRYAPGTTAVDPYLEGPTPLETFNEELRRAKLIAALKKYGIPAGTAGAGAAIGSLAGGPNHRVAGAIGGAILGGGAGIAYNNREAIKNYLRDLFARMRKTEPQA